MDISEPESDDDITFEDILERPEDTERGLSIIEKLGMRLANQLVQFNGCCQECHSQAAQEHTAQHERHFSLPEFMSQAKDHCPDILSSKKITSFQDNLQGRITVAQRRWIFSGIRPEDPEGVPVHICFNKDEVPSQTTRVSFDIDSITGFCSSLGVAQRGVRWNFMQMPVSDLQSGLHLAKQQVQYVDSHGHLHLVKKPIHQIPHYTLGRLVGFEDASLYILFPRLYREDQQSSRLLDSDFQLWLDQVLLPAIYQFYKGSQVQHYPSSFSHAKYNSTARGVEGRSQKVNIVPREQLIMKFLQPEHLPQVWQHIQELIQRPGLTQFQGALILLHAKDLKTLFKSPTWSQMVAKVEKYWGIVVNKSYVSSSFYFDVAKETCPEQSSILASSQRSQGETLFWKQCCLQSLYSWLRTGDERNACRVAKYPTTLLQESGSIAFEPGANSQLRAGGLLYGQLYNSVKEVFAAGNQYPFRNPAIEGLALDPQLQKTWQHVGAGLSHSPVALLKAYLYTKARCHYGIQDSEQKSYGVREEYRVSIELFSAISAHLESLGLHDVALGQREGALPYITHPTSTALSWFRWNINKFCAGFELVYSLNNQHWVTWEHTRVMLMFLRCLRFSYGGGHPQESAGCWRDVRHGPQRAEGLGLQVTMPRYSYGWFLEKVDWDTMTFLPPHSQYMLFNNPSMQSAYRAHSRQIRDVKEDFIHVSKAQGFLQQFQDYPACQEFIQEYLCQLCLCAFRKDVFQNIRHLIKKRRVTEALSGQVPLCMPSVTTILKTEFSALPLVSGNNLAVQSVEVLFAWLWDWEDDCFQRKHWEDKPYRVLYQRSSDIIKAAQGPRAAREWRRKLRATFIKSHWLLPYPQSNRFMKAAPGRAVWWWSSVHHGVHSYYNSQPATPRILPASHIDHYPLQGWGISSTREGRYMPFTLQPRQELLSLTEGELYTEVARLASEPLPVRVQQPLLEFSREDTRHVSRTRAQQLQIELTDAQTRLRLLHYPRKPATHVDRAGQAREGLIGSSESSGSDEWSDEGSEEGSEEGSDPTSLSTTDEDSEGSEGVSEEEDALEGELQVCIREQERLVKRKQRKLKALLRKERKVRAQRARRAFRAQERARVKEEEGRIERIRDVHRAQTQKYAEIVREREAERARQSRDIERSVNLLRSVPAPRYPQHREPGQETPYYLSRRRLYEVGLAPTEKHSI